MELDYSAIRVLAIPSDDTACGQYRLIRPLRYLSEVYGVQSRISFSFSQQDLVEYRPNVLVLQRCITPAAIPLVEFARSMGILVVYELDDNLHHVDPRSPAFSVFHPGSEALAVATRLMGMAHGCVFSTENLRAFYQFAQRNAVVVPNSIDFDLRPWERPFRYHQSQRVVVGWTFAAQHQQDYEVLDGVVHRVLARYRHVDIGFYANPAQAVELFDRYRVPPGRAVLIPPNRFEDYPYWIGAFDIGLAPLFNDQFTRGKSDLKLLEYSARRVPCVASDIEPYRLAYQQGLPVRLVSSSQEWEDAICEWIEDERARREAGESAFEFVRQHRNMKRVALQFVHAWVQIAEAARAGQSGKGEQVERKGTPGRNDPCPCGSKRKYKRCCYPAFGR